MIDFKHFIQYRSVFMITYFIVFVFNISLFSQRYSLQEEIFKLALYNTNTNPQEFPLMQLAIIDGDKIEYVYFDNGEFCNSDCHFLKFNVGEISKSVISFVLYDLVIQNKINLSDSVLKYINATETEGLSAVTIEDLLMNNTGLPTSFVRKTTDLDLTQSEINANRSLEDIYDLYRANINTEKSHSPNKEDFVLLTEIIRLASGKTYQAYVDSLFEKKNSGNFCFSECQNIVSGYDRMGNQLPTIENGIYNVVDGVYSDLEQMSFFVKYLLNNPEGQKYLEFVLANTSEHLLNAYIANNRGWNSVDVTKKRKILISQGITQGYRTFIGVFPESKKGVILLTNSGNSTEGLGYFVLKMISDNWKTKK